MFLPDYPPSSTAGRSMPLGRGVALLLLTFSLACAQSRELGDDEDAGIVIDTDGGPGPDTDGGTPLPDADIDAGEDAGPPPNTPVCGNGDLEAGEACDDGNTEPGDGCGPLCMREPYCGDGVVDPGEVCDFGDNLSGDGCRSDCLSEEVCGDGILDPHVGEACDVDEDWCVDCRVITCGDGVVDAHEECDDGNDTYLDGCDDACREEISFVVSDLMLITANRGCDYSLNGRGDNRLGRALGPLADLLNGMVLEGGVGTDIILLLHTLGLDDPAMQNDPDFQIALLNGADADSNPMNNLSGMGTFEADTLALDEDGRPLISFQSDVTDGDLVSGPQDFELLLGPFPLDLRLGRIEGLVSASAAGQAESIDDAMLCGVLPMTTAVTIPNPIDLIGAVPGLPIELPDIEPCGGGPAATFADLLVAGIDFPLFSTRPSRPDVDLDGDGLETFEYNRGSGCQPVVTACIDGDGTRVEGRDCLYDRRFVDGWSSAFDLSAVRAAIVGRGDVAPPVPLPGGGPTPAP